MGLKFHTKLEKITPIDITNIEADFFNTECYIFKVGKYFLLGKSEWDLSVDYWDNVEGRQNDLMGYTDYYEQVDLYTMAMIDEMNSLYMLRSRVPVVFLVDKIQDKEVR